MSSSTWPRETIESLISSGAIIGHKDGNYGSLYPRVEEFGPVGVPFLTAKSIVGGTLDINGAPCLADARANALRFGFVRSGDVLLSHNATIGRVALVPDFDGRLLVGTSLTYFRLNPERLSARYFAAYLASTDFQNQLTGVMSHSTRNQVPISAQRKLSVVVPPLPTQGAIASIIGALDIKIEQNRRTAKALERLARSIFRAWFVDFEPVKAKAAGATAFPSMPQHVFDALPTRFVDTVIGPVPEGWAVGQLGDIAVQRRDGVDPADVEAETPYIGLEHMPRRCISLTEWGSAGQISSTKARFCAGQILFGKLRPYFHKVGVAPIDGVCSTDIVVIEPRDSLWLAVALGHASSDEFVSHATACSTGTKMPRTNWHDMASFKIAVPPDAAAAALTGIFGPMLALLTAGIFESRQLSAMRDTLLPKLLSGIVRVDPH